MVRNQGRLREKVTEADETYFLCSPQSLKKRFLVILRYPLMLMEERLRAIW